jgi:hypothetical protein
MDATFLPTSFVNVHSNCQLSILQKIHVPNGPFEEAAALMRHTLQERLSEEKRTGRGPLPQRGQCRHRGGQVQELAHHRMVREPAWTILEAARPKRTGTRIQLSRQAQMLSG